MARASTRDVGDEVDGRFDDFGLQFEGGGVALLDARDEGEDDGDEDGLLGDDDEDDEAEYSAETIEQLRGVDLAQPTRFDPGSSAKELLLRRRYAAGLPMHIEGDSRECREVPVIPCGDDGEGDVDLLD